MTGPPASVVLIICFTIILLVLLYCEFSAEKVHRDEKEFLAAKLVAFADEMEYAELTITPDHLRDFAKDLRGDLV